MCPFALSAAEKVGIWRVPGHGEFLAARDPGLRERQDAAQAPDGCADAVAILNPEATDARAVSRNVTFADADADAASAMSPGATVVTPLFDTDSTGMGTVKTRRAASSRCAGTARLGRAPSAL